jgi:hypothetical protein
MLRKICKKVDVIGYWFDGWSWFGLGSDGYKSSSIFLNSGFS